MMNRAHWFFVAIRLVILGWILGWILGRLPFPSKNFGEEESIAARHFLTEYRKNLTLIEHIGASFVLSNRIVDVQKNQDACDVNQLAKTPAIISPYRVTVQSYTFFKIPYSKIEFSCEFNWSRTAFLSI